jgi:hypothetical protein
LTDSIAKKNPVQFLNWAGFFFGKKLFVKLALGAGQAVQ